MADVQPILPPTGQADLGSVARLGLALAAGVIAKDGAAYLVAHGLIENADTAEVVSVGTGVIIGVSAAAWAKLKNLHFGAKLVAAAATRNPRANPADASTKAAVAAAIADPKSPITAKVTS